MAAIICLPAATAPSRKENETAKDKNQEEKPKPVPIGILHLTGDAPSLSHHRKCPSLPPSPSPPSHPHTNCRLHVGEIGLSIHASHRNQGYGSEAILYALEWGFRRANLHRMGIGAFAWNQGAIKLYKKLGFVEEARRREFFWYDGEYWDCVELAMLEGEWRGRYGGRGK